MKKHWKWLAALALVCGLGLSYAAVSDAQGGITAEPIPPGYQFPAAKATVLGWVAANNVTAMRNHAWNLWAGMTAPSQSTFRGAKLPVWETWYSTAEVFSADPLPAAAERGRPDRPFVKPRQFTHFLEAPEVPSAASDQVVSFNKFDGASAQFLKASHPRPAGPSAPYDYTQQSSLTALNNAWPTGTEVKKRAVDPFPRPGINTKPVFMLVEDEGLTPIPYWQGPAASTAANCQAPVGGTPSGWSRNCHPDPNTWTTCVLVDPNGTGQSGRKPTAADLAEIVPNSTLACTTYPLVVPLSMFYNFELDAQEAAAFTQNQGITAEAGDFAIFVAMHVTSKEIPHWTWQTYWWQAGKNPPNKYPGSVDGMISKVKGPWRNYAMCNAYSMLASTGKPVVCFNPFLETSPGIPDGLNSNCMTCHGSARFPGNNNFPGTQVGYPPKYPYPLNFNDAQLFGTQTQTDFAWAITVNAVAPAGN